MRFHTLRAVALLCFAALLACHQTPAPVSVPAPAAPTYATGEAVVAAMHDHYAGRWYQTLTFKQTTSRRLSNGSWDVQTWYEALKLPGRLRIDFAPLSAGNGVLYASDSQYVMLKGRINNEGPGINDLLLLGFDIYGNPIARSTALLRKQGFDLNRVHVTELDGRPVVVVGAYEGDTHRKQFWIDRERLIFVRLLEPAPRDTTKVQDIRFTKYEQFGDAWVAARVEIYTGDLLSLTEDYTDLHTGAMLDDDLFVPTSWKTAKHWLTTEK
jgi:outer membrane lipoprotein-sorting protein